MNPPSLPLGVRGEEHAPESQRFEEFLEYPRQLLARHLEEAGVGEYAVKGFRWKVEREEVLVQHRTYRVLTRQVHEGSGAAEPGGTVSLLG